MSEEKMIFIQPKLLKRRQAEERYNMCWNTLCRAAQDAGALVRYGKSVFFNSTILDAYFDALSGCE